MKKKIFAISDIHGFYTEMIESLKESGYDEDNPEHLLIVCGDKFDRGKESVKVFQYLKRLMDKNKAIILRGNHLAFIENFLEGSNDPFNYINNGLNETIADFWHRTSPFESWCALEGNCELSIENYSKWAEIARKDINKEYPELLPWIKSLPYYYETENYVFTHGMIDGQCYDWHHPNISWYECTWAKPRDFNNSIVNTDKKVVVGHINCGLLRSLYGYDENDNSIFERPDGKVIGLDTCTVLTHKVNVLVLEDEIIED